MRAARVCCLCSNLSATRSCSVLPSLHLLGSHSLDYTFLRTQAPLAGPALLSRIVKLHYNWKYMFLRPTLIKIIQRYNIKFRPTFSPEAP